MGNDLRILVAEDDPSVTNDKPGNMLAYMIQSTWKAKVTVHGQQYTGIPMETCTVCHEASESVSPFKV